MKEMTGEVVRSCWLISGLGSYERRGGFMGVHPFLSI